MLKTAAALLLIAGLAACQPQGARTLAPTQGDAFLGAADAKVVVVEYGAPTCPGCKSWHDQFWSRMKTTYVDSNKIKFVWRELPSHNPPVDAAIFGIARCVGGAGYFEVLDAAFESQMAIEMASRSAAGPREELVKLGKKFTLSEAQTQACITDPKLVDRIYEVQEMADAKRVNSTPTFFINDVEVRDPRFESMQATIDALLAGGPAPAQAPAPAEDHTGHDH